MNRINFLVALLTMTLIGCISKIDNEEQTIYSLLDHLSKHSVDSSILQHHYFTETFYNRKGNHSLYLQRLAELKEYLQTDPDFALEPVSETELNLSDDQIGRVFKVSFNLHKSKDSVYFRMEGNQIESFIIIMKNERIYWL